MRQLKVHFVAIGVLQALLGLCAKDAKVSAWQEPQRNNVVKWHTNMDDAAAESAQTGKPILMEINGRPWCPPCNTQGEKIINHAEFQAWARDRVVLLDFKVGQGYQKDKGNPIWREQMKKHGLSSIPSAVMLDPNGERMGVVFPKEDVRQWIGAANNVITAHALKPQVQTQVIPFRLTKWNNISIPATLNNTISLNLMFHTAVNSVSLTKATTERFREITLNENADVQSWGGQSTSRVGKGHSLRIAQLTPQTVTLFEGLHSGHDTDGKLGPAQLASKILAIDFDRSEIRLLTNLPVTVKKWQKLRMETDGGMMFITGAVHSGGKHAEHPFMIHSGYSGFALLDDVFVAKHPFLSEHEVLEESEVKDSAGNKLATRRISLPKFRVGKTEFEDAPVSFFSGAIGKQKFSVLGGDFLKRFNLVFDFENQALYLEKSQYFEAEHD